MGKDKDCKGQCGICDGSCRKEITEWEKKLLRTNFIMVDDEMIGGEIKTLNGTDVSNMSFEDFMKVSDGIQPKLSRKNNRTLTR
jgi:hypothetical protein